MRTVTVPEGKALFLPVVDYEADTVPPPKTRVPTEGAGQAVIDSVTTSYARLDGSPLENLADEIPNIRLHGAG